MSIVKLRKGVRKQIKFRLFGRTVEFGSAMAIILWIIVLIFIVGTYYMYGPGGGGGGQQGQQATTRKVSAVIATADGVAISRQEYEYRLSLARRSQNSSDVSRMRYVKTDIFDSLVDRELQRAAASTPTRRCCTRFSRTATSRSTSSSVSCATMTTACPTTSSFARCFSSRSSRRASRRTHT
jgi:hypothetical protein